MGLLNVIKKQEMRRLFGQRELFIIQKQLLGVHLKNSERTRLSRDIRKKLEAVKLLSPFSGEFELKKGSEIKRIITEAKEVVLESRFFPRVKKIILFGSAVENKLNLFSDLDLAVEFTALGEGEATIFRREVLGKVNEKLDIQVYNSLPVKIKKEIDAKGKAIYERTD